MEANLKVYQSFADRENCFGGNIRAINNKLFSYNTCIMEWQDSTLLVNKTYYSTTTSKHRNTALKVCGNVTTIVLENVPKDTQSLSEFIIENERNS